MNLETNIQYVNVENIIPNRFQPRLTFDENALKELAMSIKEHGIIQPLVLRRLTNDKFEIIAGERRYKASQIAGLENVPAIIANLDDNESAEVALIENIQRRNLSAIEEAKSYKKLLDRGYLTQDQLAKRLGISQSSVANKVRLLNLTEEVQEALINEKISERHARSLLQLTDKQEQINMLNKIIEKRMTVRQLDSEIREKIINPKSEILEIKEEPTNLEIFNLSNKSNDVTETLETIDLTKSEFDILDIPTAVETSQDTNKVEISNKTKIISGDINSVINTLKEIEKETKEAGFDIESETYDFEDLYQIIIKIEK